MYFTEKQLKIMEFIQQFRAERGIGRFLVRKEGKGANQRFLHQRKAPQ